MGAVADFIYSRVRGQLRFSQEIEDQIDTDKKKEREDKATGDRSRQGYERANEAMDAVRKEMDAAETRRKRKSAPPSHGRMNGVRG